MAEKQTVRIWYCDGKSPPKVRGKWQAMCCRNDALVMCLYFKARDDAERVADMWRAGANMARIAEYMKAVGLEITV